MICDLFNLNSSILVFILILSIQLVICRAYWLLLFLCTFVAHTNTNTGLLLAIVTHEFAWLFYIACSLNVVICIGLVLRMNHPECILTFCCVCVWDYLWCIYIFLFFFFVPLFCDYSCI